VQAHAQQVASGFRKAFRSASNTAFCAGSRPAPSSWFGGDCSRRASLPSGDVKSATRASGVQRPSAVRLARRRAESRPRAMMMLSPMLAREDILDGSAQRHRDTAPRRYATEKQVHDSVASMESWEESSDVSTEGRGVSACGLCEEIESTALSAIAMYVPVATFICVAWLASLADGWSAPGHLVTAALAQRHLSSRAAAAVSRDLGSYSPFYPSENDFVTAAEW